MPSLEPSSTKSTAPLEPAYSPKTPYGRHRDHDVRQGSRAAESASASAHSVRPRFTAAQCSQASHSP
ncbi:hypothetical protein [Streptomyces chartreusis]|uniref:hypothetical protein n=1 Tax=Streptomyces chartreusis TaxID=1969 RepID=UPI003405996C